MNIARVCDCFVFSLYPYLGRLPCVWLPAPLWPLRTPPMRTVPQNGCSVKWYTFFFSTSSVCSSMPSPSHSVFVPLGTFVHYEQTARSEGKGRTHRHKSIGTAANSKCVVETVIMQIRSRSGVGLLFHAWKCLMHGFNRRWHSRRS